MIKFFKKLFASGDEIDNYQFKGVEDITYQCSAYRGLMRHTDAIRLYEKFENQIVNNDLELPALSTILKICDEANDTARLTRFGRRLRDIADDHPHVATLRNRGLI